MKNKIISAFAALAIFMVGCHQPDDVLVTDNGGLLKVSAQFATGDYKSDANAIFSTDVTESNLEKIVIDVPYFYPEESNNLTEITKMRVIASLGDNCFLSPKLGTLDLTKENYFTLTNSNGSTKKVCITGRIVKSNKCSILSFAIDNPALEGIIDEEKKTISLITIDNLPAAKATVIASPHATVSPDPSVAANYDNNDMKFTVTAYDGTTKATYTVIKVVPPKIKYGVRPGSMKLLWKKQFVADYNFSTINMTGGMAVTGNYLMLNTRNMNSILINRTTGERLANDYELPTELKGSLVNFYNTSDDDGNVLISNLSPGAGAFKIWKIAAGLQTQPEVFIEWAGGLAMGRCISVKGSINSNAIITAPIHTGDSQFARWQVIGGVLKSQTPEIITITGVAWTNTSVDVVASSATDITADYFVTGYKAGNTTAVINGKTNTIISKLTDIIGGNYVSNRCDVTTFNGARYFAYLSVNGFSWGGGGGDNATTDCCWMVDATVPSQFLGDPRNSSNPIFVMLSGDYMSRSVAANGAVNGNTTGDIIFAQSKDGYMLYMYMMITNGWVVAWQFDCIDK